MTVPNNLIEQHISIKKASLKGVRDGVISGIHRLVSREKAASAKEQDRNVIRQFQGYGDIPR